MSYTASELEHLLEDYHAAVPYSYTKSNGEIIHGVHTYESWDGLENQLDRVDSFIQIDGIGEIGTIESVGGEGQGDYAAMIFEVTDAAGSKRMFRKEGYYASFDGTTWEDGDFAEVEAYEKTVTDYREIKNNG